MRSRGILLLDTGAGINLIQELILEPDAQRASKAELFLIGNDGHISLNTKYLYLQDSHTNLPVRLYPLIFLRKNME
jgi:hypothetical protein